MGIPSDPHFFSDAFELAERVTLIACGTAIKQATRRLNHKHAPVNRLPVEILATAFEWLEVPDRWTAATVCQYWRCTALAHLALWTNIECDISAQDAKPSLPTAIERARGHSIQLSLRIFGTFSDERVSWFCHSLALWTRSVKALFLHLDLPVMYGYDDDSDEDDEGDDNSNGNGNGNGNDNDSYEPLDESSFPPFMAFDLVLGRALSSASLPRLEYLDLVDIPFQLHPQRVPSLRYLHSSSRVLLNCGNAITLISLQAAHLSVAQEATPVSTLLGHSSTLQQLDITPCLSHLAAALRLDLQPRPLANLCYLRWPSIGELDRSTAESLIKASADRSWTHCMFSSAVEDEPSRHRQRTVDNERLFFVIDSLPLNSISELHIQHAPGSAGTFARVATTTGAQWMIPEVCLQSDEIQSICQRISSSLRTATIPTSECTLFGSSSCDFPRLKTLVIEIYGERRLAHTGSPLGVPVDPSRIVPHPKSSGLSLSQFWIAPKLQTLRLKLADCTESSWARQCRHEPSLNGQIRCEAAWDDWTARVTAFSVSELLVASLKPAASLRLVLHGIEMLEEDEARLPFDRIERFLPLSHCIYDIPAVFAQSPKTYGMYASLARAYI